MDSHTHSRKYDFNNLFTFEMANNHQGSVEHGKKIIAEMARIAKDFNLKASVKLQFRDLNTFIHPKYRHDKNIKHIPRFVSTELNKNQFRELVGAVRKAGLITMATAFDENSVELLRELDVEIIKVASCSAQDWPLLEKIASVGKPVIVSIGGLELKDIDKVVSFFEHRGTDFALMHCVAIYPTPMEKLYLNQIEIMKNRYPRLTIGFSTHEAPDNISVIGMAYAKGARIFEKHVGVPTETIKLNAYSANPTETRKWVEAYTKAVAACGDNLDKRPVDPQELEDLRSLARCVFAKRQIKVGEKLVKDDVFFAMPLLSESHLASGQFREGLTADRDYVVGEPLNAAVVPRTIRKKDLIYSIIHAVKGMLNGARIPMSHDFMVEISHHYGIEKFNEIGCVIIDCVNREYAKKLIVQLPGQFHPIHYHKIKDETFQILSGSMEAEIEGKRKMLYPGDTLWVPRGVWHSFKTETGVIFEEISTASMELTGDSFYVDKLIASTPRESRKTKLLNWGRHQFDHLNE